MAVRRGAFLHAEAPASVAERAGAEELTGVAEELMGVAEEHPAVACIGNRSFVVFQADREI